MSDSGQPTLRLDPQGSSSSSGSSTSQLAYLVPSYDPAKDELLTWSQKVELLSNAWPEDKFPELIARLILNCSGSAFQKLQLHQAELMQGGRGAVKTLVTLLGGYWGKVPLEKRYEATERALYRCTQKSDEAHDSYLARSDIAWSELLSKKTTLQDIQAYVLLRGAQLSSDDKKRVILESDASGDGSLTVERVVKAIRLLGAGFFQEMVSGKRGQRAKVYDSATAFQHEEDEGDEGEAFHTWSEEPILEEEVMDIVISEGDEDAALIADFEGACLDLIQGDPELASAYNAYADARKRLTDKAKFRGFWPSSKGSSKGKGYSTSSRPKGKGKFGNGGQRRSLQDKIRSSTCRICGQRGHWKAECPHRPGANSGAATSASGASSFTGLSEAGLMSAAEGLPLEFVNLPEMELPVLEEATRSIDQQAFSFVAQVSRLLGTTQSKPGFRENPWGVSGNRETFGDRTVLRRVLSRNSEIANAHRFRDAQTDEKSREKISRLAKPAAGLSEDPSKTADALSSATQDGTVLTSGSVGILDTGATKTVIGSSGVAAFIHALHPDVQKQLARCDCRVVFRFGNQGTLSSSQAIVVPLGKLKLKIAVVPGRTPLLLSNTLFRALRVQIDTHGMLIHSPYLTQPIPIQLSSKGLFMLDVNALATNMSSKISGRAQSAVTFLSETEERESPEGKMPTSPTCVSQDSVKLVPSSVPSETQSGACPVHTPDGSVGAPDAGSQAGRFPDRGELNDLGRARDPSGYLRQDDDRTYLRHGLEEAPEVAHVVRQDVSQVREDGASEADPLRDPPGDLRGGGHGLRGSQPLQGVHHEAREVWPGDRPRPSLRDADQVQSGPPGEDGQGGPAGGAVGNGGDESRDGGPESRGDAAELADRQHGEPLATDCEPHSGSPGSEIEGQPVIVPTGTPALSASEAMLSAADHDADESADPPLQKAHDRRLLLRLIRKYQEELVQHRLPRSSPESLLLLEVFCSASSQLTDQCLRQGFRAQRFGKQQGDLMTSIGRQQLFHGLVHGRPEHVWFAPECRVWSAWSRFNSQRSRSALEKFTAERVTMLQQVALGIVLQRFQMQHSRHFHWEQPLGSTMFELPILSELREQLWCASFDMCQVADLSDPLTGMPLKKGTIVLTSCQRVHMLLHGRRCDKQHSHQPIEGSTLVEGQRMLRSEFSGYYSRRFARQVVHAMKSSSALRSVAFAASSDGPMAKRHRSLWPRQRIRPAPVGEPTLVDDPANVFKRRRLVGKQEGDEVDAHAFLRQIHELLPRVGKISLTDPELLKALQSMFPERSIVACVAGRGIDRTMTISSPFTAADAPWRRSLFIRRADGQVCVETAWEKWDTLPKHQVIRRNHACRICVTVFGRDLETMSTVPNGEAPESSSPGTGSDSSLPPDPSQLSQRQEVDRLDPRQDATFRSLSRSEQQWIVKVHQNLGHPSPEKLSHVLRNQGVDPRLIDAAQKYRCSTCQELKGPLLARPATLKDPLDFNDRIAMDELVFSSRSGQRFHVFHIVDFGTSYQTAFCVPSPSSEQIIDGLVRSWLSWAGAPGELLLDSATEFCSEQFLTLLQSASIRCTPVAPRAHWQNGKSERHGQVLEHMLKKYDLEHEIRSLQEMNQALWFTCQAKNALGIRRGFSPEMLVLGKQTRLPGSILSDETVAAHGLAESDTGQGVAFREMLAKREAARRAFHSADNSAALRRAILRRTRPARQQYSIGEWVMLYKAHSNLPGQGQWMGPMRVVNGGDQHTLWATMKGRLYRGALEHFRPLSANEALQIPASEADQETVPVHPDLSGPVPPPARPDLSIPPPRSLSPDSPHQRQVSISTLSQPDHEPGTLPQPLPSTDVPDPVDIPVPQDDEGLFSEHDDTILRGEAGEELVWRTEITFGEKELSRWDGASLSDEAIALVADTAKKQHAEVKLSTLSLAEKELFQQAKSKEIKNWLDNKAVEKIARDRISPSQILRCRWVLTWKALDPSEVTDPSKAHKAKARLVVLGYLDPELDQVPRDSPTLSRHSRMLLLQLIASCGWVLQSFDVKAAFLQGKPNDQRLIGLEPVPELSDALQVQSHETLRLVKSAYGLIDAPYLWYCALRDALVKLGFEIAPWDPCVFVLRCPKTHQPEGVIGVHVDDGLCGGNERFQGKSKSWSDSLPSGLTRRRGSALPVLTWSSGVTSELSCLSQNTCEPYLAFALRRLVGISQAPLCCRKRSVS